MKLLKKDYIEILDYYGLKYSKKLPVNLLRNMCEDIIAKKICSCIKKVKVKFDNKKQDESRRIAICRNSVAHKKQLNIHKFTCKKRPKLLNKKGDIRSGKLYKTTKQKLSLKKKYAKKN